MAHQASPNRFMAQLRTSELGLGSTSHQRAARQAAQLLINKAFIGPQDFHVALGSQGFIPEMLRRRLVPDNKPQSALEPAIAKSDAWPGSEPDSEGFPSSPDDPFGKEAEIAHPAGDQEERTVRHAGAVALTNA